MWFHSLHSYLTHKMGCVMKALLKEGPTCKEPYALALKIRPEV